MSLYEFLLFAHIAAAAVWFGGGLMVQVLAGRALRSRDDAAVKRVVDDTAAMSMTVFVPASIVVLLVGIALVLEGSWSFGDLWIVLGLAGYAATFATGVGVLKPASEKAAAMLARDGMTPAAQREIRRLVTLARIDYVVLVLVLVVMAAKPTGDDTALLAAMAVVLVGGIAYFATKARAADQPGSVSPPIGASTSPE